MSVHSAAELITELEQLHILSARQLEELGPALHNVTLDVRGAARLLLDRDWLTPFQVNHILQGQSSRLIVGSYILVRRIGAGVLGDVYQAKHQRMRRHVSLTMVRQELLTRPGAVERFYKEIQAVSRLSHPHIVCAFDAGPAEEGHFFAMEWVDGIDLEKLVQQNGPLRVSTACAFIHQAALGLEHAASRGVLHHDLKPANLLIARLTGPGEPHSGDSPAPSTSSATNGPCLKINNLGLSLLQPRAPGSTAPATAGSPDFLAPELALGGQVSDVRSNLYSLGCTFFWLLTGKVPFPGEDSSVILQKHRDVKPPPLSQFRDDVASEIETIVRRLMAKRPEDRFATPAELSAELARQSGDVPAPPTPPILTDTKAAVELDSWPTASASKDHTSTQIPERPVGAGVIRAVGWRRPLVLVAALALFLGVACLGGYLLSRFIRPAPVPIEHEQQPAVQATEAEGPPYARGATRQETILATLRANHLPSLEGPWYYIGPFDGGVGDGFNREYPPEKEIDLKRSYIGKSNVLASWKEFKDFRPGQAQNLRIFGNDDDAAVYLYLPIEVTSAIDLPVGFGSDDTLQVWLNHKLLISRNVARSLKPDTEMATLKLHPGKNELLIKVCNGNGQWAAYVMPRWPTALEKALGERLEHDFPKPPPSH
jgi:serine/threonine-protein kinase